MASPTRSAPHTKTIQSMNTFQLEHGEVYHLVVEYCGAYHVNILNLGPCTIYIREDADPVINDPMTETLPPGTADNQVLVANGPAGIRVLAGPPCACEILQRLDESGCEITEPRPLIGRGASISVRLVRG